jgi:hypothetical protein
MQILCLLELGFLQFVLKDDTKGKHEQGPLELALFLSCPLFSWQPNGLLELALLH